MIPRARGWKFGLLALAFSSGAAHALSTGNELLGLMQGSTEERTIAMQYINGVVDGIYQAEAIAQREFLCPPANVTIGQMRDVVRKHLDSYPATRHLLSGSLVYVALSSAWPCPPATKK